MITRPMARLRRLFAIGRARSNCRHIFGSHKRLPIALKNAYGNPFSEKSLTGVMQHWPRQAGIPDGYTLHGLRRTFGTYLAECNIQARAIMEAMGRSSMTVTDEYVREADKKRIAVDMARAINQREEKRDEMKRQTNLRSPIVQIRSS